MADHDDVLMYPPQVLRQYAMLADGERGVIVGPRGDFCWMCVPRWDSDAVFSSLIGGGGIYAVTPEEPFVWGGYYERASLIWRSRWVTTSGVVECREALAFPGDPRCAVLLRRIMAVRGDARVNVICDPRPEFGAHGLRSPRRGDDGVWRTELGGLHMRWSGAGDASVRTTPHGDRRLETNLEVPAGGHHDLVLELGDRPLTGRRPDADRLWEATETAWRETTLRTGTIADRDARHAVAVMRGLTSRGGGMVAAATTSLPERSGAERNYDYRYVWIRDQCYAGQAAAAAGVDELLDDAVRFVSARLLDDGPDLKPAYTVDGGPLPDQRSLDLPGYPGGHDEIGNRVTHQFQLDTFGEALLLIAAAARQGRLDDDARRAAHAAVTAIERRRHGSDAGIWELEDRVWTHSRLICAAGLRALAGAVPDDPMAERWTSLADTIVAETVAFGVHPSGRWQRAADDPRNDGALLLPAIRGAVPPDDPRVRPTLEAYVEQLTDDGYAYRFRHDERPLGEAEGAFLLCGFLLAIATHQQGDDRQALRWFERNRAACGPAGIFSEEYDVTQRQMRGNLPQAFVHAVLLEAAARLAGPPCGRTGAAPPR
ncbi:glycoside hydrolase family 15 protein [Actinoallomurus sp. CA-142502]|uniref:glycoside hydrolase family 15 protein n=1 Tax=Actinoallomurus sp. CA-142502 TaxID=3239885 RepID=UPI003D90DD5B